MQGKKHEMKTWKDSKRNILQKRKVYDDMWLQAYECYQAHSRWRIVLVAAGLRYPGWSCVSTTADDVLLRRIGDKKLYLWHNIFDVYLNFRRRPDSSFYKGLLKPDIEPVEGET